MLLPLIWMTESLSLVSSLFFELWCWKNKKKPQDEKWKNRYVYYCEIVRREASCCSSFVLELMMAKKNFGNCLWFATRTEGINFSGDPCALRYSSPFWCSSRASKHQQRSSCCGKFTQIFLREPKSNLDVWCVHCRSPHSVLWPFFFEKKKGVPYTAFVRLNWRRRKKK